MILFAWCDSRVSVGLFCALPFKADLKALAGGLCGGTRSEGIPLSIGPTKNIFLADNLQLLKSNFGIKSDNLRESPNTYLINVIQILDIFI